MSFLSGRGCSSELKAVQLNAAIAYLQAVKETFHDQPAVYKHFSALLQNSEDYDLIMSTAATLFRGYPHLIEALNPYLRSPCRVEYNTRTRLTTVTSSSGVKYQI
ncbi:hypothetical protein ARMSODRAFT_948991 [Armillaria solidipes]|uniref:Uncharacterized protein n=1 Tax=Armillaria solidipes TaxID=1076256 RepID=A0A2H3CK13_9AGAR|nr:hypothetical protein ARMSODRAFT_948991 [Armillaria solidipes]